MPIELTDNRIPSAPVLSHQVIGQIACIAIVRFEERNKLKKNTASGQMEPIPNGTRPDGSQKFKQELVIHGVAMDGCTMQAKLGDHAAVPAAGDRVRLILSGLSYGEWIEAKKQYKATHGKIAVGDLLFVETTHAQAYDESHNKKGPPIYEQEAAMAVRMRGGVIGWYGPIQLAPAASPEWQEHCEQLYHQDQAAIARQQATQLDEPEGFDDFSPQGAAPAPARPMAPPPMASRPSAPPARPMAPPPIASRPPAPVRPPF